jgi:hypothetical protein
MTITRTFAAIAIALLVAAIVATGAQAAKGGGSKPPKQPTATPGPSGATSRIAFNKLVTQGKGRNATSHLQVIVADPDGSNDVQITDTGSNAPLSWSHDGWLLIENEGVYRILDVPDSNPGSATEVLNFTLPANSGVGLWSSHDAGAGILPSSQQLLAGGVAPVPGTSQVAVWRHDGTNPTIVTNHTSTCIPDTGNPCSGSRFEAYLRGWLPSDTANDTIRILYQLREYQYAAGVEVDDTLTYRTVTLDASSWPSVAVAGDESVAFSGAVVTARNATVSRDGAWIAYDQNLDAPNEPYLHVAPLDYDSATGITTLRSDLATTTADISGLGSGFAVYLAGGFSPDNSQVVVQGLADSMHSVFVADADGSGPTLEVDGTDKQAGSAIWGP